MANLINTHLSIHNLWRASTCEPDFAFCTSFKFVFIHYSFISARPRRNMENCNFKPISVSSSLSTTQKKLCSYVHYTKPQKYEITLQNCEFRLVISYWEKINIMPCIVWLESFVLASFKELIRENTFALRMARETAHLMHLLETNVYANYNYQRCIIITEGSRIVRHKRPTMRLFFFTSVCKIGSMPGNLHVYVKCVR